MTHLAKALTIFVTLALYASAGASELQDAARDATRACAAVDAQSLQHCGEEMVGRSAEQAEARKAVRRVLKVRARFLTTCDEPSTPGGCAALADWYMEAGAAEVLNAPVAHLQSTAPH